MKKILTTIFVAMAMLICVACSTTNKPETRPTTYQTVSWATIRQEGQDNIARTTEKYVGKYYSFSGELFYIANDASYITINEINPGKMTSSVFCKVIDQEDRQTILNAKADDLVIIKGKITDIEYDSWSKTVKIDMDLYEIQIQ